MVDVEGATLQLWDQITSMPLLHTGSEKRAALVKLLRWWVEGSMAWLGMAWHRSASMRQDKK